MISAEEFKTIRAGDYVHFMDEWMDDEFYETEAGIDPPDSDMDAYRGATLQVDTVYDDGSCILTNASPSMYWYRYEIDYIVAPPCDETPDDTSSKADILSLFG